MGGRGGGRQTQFDESQFVAGSYDSGDRELEYLQNARGEEIGHT